jgi:uncharacterized protein YdaU (DUF1376 family)
MADKRNPYFRFYPADFMGGVRGMTAQEVGVYTMLLCRMYEEDGPIECDTFRLATYCGMRVATFTATLEKLIRLGKIEPHDGALFNDRARREIAIRADGLEVAIRAGKVSAEKRQQKQGRAEASVDAPFNHTDTDTDTEIDKKKREAKASTKKTSGARLSAEWFLPMGWGEWALQEGMQVDAIRVEADTFKDYWISVAGSKGLKTNWEATWRNWIRKAMKDGQRNGNFNRRAPEGSKRPDPALANILRLTGLDQAPGGGGH